MPAKKVNPKKEEVGEIWECLENQEKTIQSLEEAVTALEERLSPIIPEREGSEPENPKSAETELGQRITKASFRTSQAQERLANMISYVQI